MAEIEFSIVSATDDVLPLGSEMSTRETYRLMKGVKGFGKTDVNAIFEASAGVGRQYRGSTPDGRTVVLPIETNGSDRMSTLEALRRLSSALDTVTNRPLPKIVATFATGEVFELPFAYVSGAEDTYDESDLWVEWKLKLFAPKPFWTAQTAEQASVTQPVPSGAYLPMMSRMRLNSSTTIGALEITNVGDVEAPIEVVVTGPGGPTSFSLNGLGWKLNTVLEENEHRRIDTATKMIYNDAGNRVYGELDTTPLFPSLPKGRSRAEISMTGASAGRWEPTGVPLYTNRIDTPALRTSRSGWSAESGGQAAELHSASGFGGSDDGYLQLTWSAAAPPGAAFRRTFAALEGEIVSPSMSVETTRAQIVQAIVTMYDVAGDVVISVLGEPVEAPANTVVRVGIAGSIIGALPPGVVRGEIVASTVISASVAWSAGDQMRASRASVTDTDEIEPYTDGRSKWSAWVGEPDASSSIRSRLERAGFSEVAMFYRPRREVMH